MNLNKHLPRHESHFRDAIETDPKFAQAKANVPASMMLDYQTRLCSAMVQCGERVSRTNFPSEDTMRHGIVVVRWANPICNTCRHKPVPSQPMLICQTCWLVFWCSPRCRQDDKTHVNVCNKQDAPAHYGLMDNPYAPVFLFAPIQRPETRVRMDAPSSSSSWIMVLCCLCLFLWFLLRM